MPELDNNGPPIRRYGVLPAPANDNAITNEPTPTMPWTVVDVTVATGAWAAWACACSQLGYGPKLKGTDDKDLIDLMTSEGL